MGDKNKIEVKIQSRQYTIVAKEPDEYIYKSEIIAGIERYIEILEGVKL